MTRKKLILIFYLFFFSLQNVPCQKSQGFSGRVSRISSISAESMRNYEFSGFKTDRVVAEEYVQKLVGKTQYFMPEMIEADIYCKEKGREAIEEPENSKKDLNGCKSITSKDKTVGKILEYIYLQKKKMSENMREQFENVLMPTNIKCKIGFPLPKNIFGKAFLLDSALSFSEDDLKELVVGKEKMVYEKPKVNDEEEKEEEEKDNNDDDDDDDEGDVQLSTYVLKLNPFGKPKTSPASSIPREEEPLGEKANSPLLSNREEGVEEEQPEGVEEEFRISTPPSTGITPSPETKSKLSTLYSFQQRTESSSNIERHKRVHSEGSNIPVIQTHVELKSQATSERGSFIEQIVETDEDIEAIKKLERSGKSKVDGKIKDEIKVRVKSIKRKWLDEINKLKSFEEKENKIKEWKKIIEDWEKKARDIFDQKIEVKKDEEGHKRLIEQQVHPFRFLQEVNFGVSIKPSNKRFNEINGAEYEEIIEFLKNPKKFLVWPPKKNQKNENDSRGSYEKKSEEEIIEQSEQPSQEKEEKDDPWGNHINRWENKLSEKIMKFMFWEMKKIEKRLKKEGKLVEEEEGEGQKEETQMEVSEIELVPISGHSRDKGKKIEEEKSSSEKGPIETVPNDEYINKVINEEFEWLKLGFGRRVLEKFMKKEKIKKFRKFNIKVFVEFRDDLLKIDKEIENCQQVKDPILAVFRYEGKDDMVHQEFRGRMGAQIIASVYNAKQLTKDILRAMLLSMVGAGIIAAALDLGVWFGLIKLVLLTKCILCAQIVGALLYSLTPLFAETFDSLVIKRLLVTFDGGEFWPDTLDKFIDNLKDAFVAGRIAAAGSIFNNILGMEKITKRLGVRLLAPSVPSNQVATSTSGAMVPLEFHEWRDHQRAALYKLYDQGFLPKPDINTIVVEWREKKRNRIWHKVTFKHFIQKTSPIITSEEKDLAFREHIKSKIEASMDIQKTSAMALNSMGIGSLLSQIVLLVLFFPVRKGIISEPVEKIFLIIVNTPTEILSFGAGIIASKWGAEKVEKCWSSDDMKNKQMIRLIIDRTIKQMDHPDKEFQEIKENEIYKIYHPKLQLLFRYGKWITKFMIVTFKFMTKPSLFKQINLSKMTLPLFKEEEINEDLNFKISYLPEPLDKMPKMPGIDEEKLNEFIEDIG
uniref:Uncharacterized protein n=1 Tax=Meloidogyne enterolobii TaxID=390850 RepID=A0A6V7VZX2_MELEN|nr:unnamed protein product [Meloidogyne enterolobii]